MGIVSIIDEYEYSSNNIMISIDKMDVFIEKIIKNRADIGKELIKLKDMIKETDDETLKLIFELLTQTLLFSVETEKFDSPTSTRYFEKLYHNIHKLKKVKK